MSARADRVHAAAKRAVTQGYFSDEERRCIADAIAAGIETALDEQESASEFQPPPHANAEVHAKIMAQLNAMTPEQIRETAPAPARLDVGKTARTLSAIVACVSVAKGREYYSEGDHTATLEDRAYADERAQLLGERDALREKNAALKKVVGLAFDHICNAHNIHNILAMALADA